MVQQDVDTDSNNGNGERHDHDVVDDDYDEAEDPFSSSSSNHGFAMDVRLLLVLMAMTMAASFGAGFCWVPDSTTGLAFPKLSSVVVPPPPPSTTMDALNSKQQLELDEEERLIQQSHPSGQHLLIDIKNLEADFLDSEERLVQAMVDTVQEAGLALLSYHCHALTPSGISCVGVMHLGSHISFHTWPYEGVITLDLFTCSGGSSSHSMILPDMVHTVERLFGYPRSKEEKIVTKWGHELRGFHHGEEKAYLDDSSDLGLMVLSPADVHRKEHVYSTVTKYQRIDIWDLVESDDTPSHQDGLTHNLKKGDPRWLTPELATPDRMLFLDGTLQSLSYTEHEYHEALVHPAMLTHPHPRHVAIVGGGEGATLREVLKHNTLEQVTMVEIDPDMVAVARQYLPNMSNCSHLVGRAENCFDDPLANVVFEDAFQWFMDRWGPSPTIQQPQQLDVVIIDALDPEDSGPIADKLYTDVTFLSSMVNSLSDDGILILQVGTPPTLHDPRPDKGIYWRRDSMLDIFENMPEVQAMMIYEEAHCGFNEPHAFLVVCRHADCRSRWYAEIDVVDFHIYQRMVRTHPPQQPQQQQITEKQRALLYYDGSLQHSYQVTPKAWETVYCRREPTPFECAYRSLDPTKQVHEFYLNNTQASSFRIESTRTIKASVNEKDYNNKDNDEGDDDDFETHVYATVDIPAGSYIMPSQLAPSLIITNKSLASLEANLEVDGAGRVAVIEDLVDFIEEYGHESATPGIGLHVVEVGATYVIRSTTDVEQANVGRWMPSHPNGRRPKFSPVYDRHRLSFDVFLVATKDIPKGAELVRDDNLWN